jgi:hypothetical protein
MKCGLCVRVVRKTTLVHAPDETGKLRRVRACSSCASKGITIVPIGGVVRCACGELAKVCANCASDKSKRDVRKLVAPIVDKLRALAKAYPNDRGEGIEQAADYLESGGWS